MPHEHAGYKATAVKKKGNVNKINQPLATKESLLSRYTGTNAPIVAAVAQPPPVLVAMVPVPNTRPSALPVAPPPVYGPPPIDPMIQFLLQQQAMMAQMIAYMGQQPHAMGQVPLPTVNMPLPPQPNIPYTAAAAYNRPVVRNSDEARERVDRLKDCVTADSRSATRRPITCAAFCSSRRPKRCTRRSR
jgi:hypothetical protein